MSTYAQRFRYGLTSGNKIISIYDEEFIDVLDEVKISILMKILNYKM